MIARRLASLSIAKTEASVSKTIIKLGVEIMSNNIKTTAVIMAAGKGTRMKSALPKVLHKAAGRTMLQQVLHQVRAAGVDEQVIVVGHGADEVQIGRAHV